MPIAVGMHLPFGLATPILIGGLLAHFFSGDTKGETQGKRLQRGIMFSSWRRFIGSRNPTRASEGLHPDLVGEANNKQKPVETEFVAEETFEKVGRTAARHPCRTHALRLLPLYGDQVTEIGVVLF